MCGIAGMIFTASTTQVDASDLHRMCDEIRHRGPDDAGYFISGPAGLGMRRLSIIDLNSGQQPIHNENNTVHIVYNGEIYNYLDIRRILEAKGHAFYTQSDTEVVLHAYEEYGEACLSQLRGMFALALWDEKQKKLLLAIDRVGIKPLYYYCDEAMILFGSELQCIRAANKVACEIDYEALAQYFTLGYIPAPRSIFQRISKLLPGHYLTWTAPRGAIIQPYWDFPRATIPSMVKPAQIRYELREKLKDAVRSHLISDVPLGAFLSGGIDSSIVVALMSEVAHGPIETFSIGFEDRAYNELEKARLVAKQFGTRHHEMVIRPESIDILPEIVAHFGEPFADSSALPTYYVSKLARQYVTVALSGDGGDELFLGYTVFRGLEAARLFQKLPAWLRRGMSFGVERLPASGLLARSGWFRKWKRRLADSMLPPRQAYLSKILVGGLESIAPLLSEQVRFGLREMTPDLVVNEYLDRIPPTSDYHALERYVYTGLKLSLPGDMLVKVDRMSMANSLEVRVPLLDPVLTEYVSALPIEQRFPRWRLKGLLKDSVADILPASILNQPKQGFSVPLTAWFRGDLVSFTDEILLSAEARQSGFWNFPALESFLHHQKMRPELGRGSLLWSLLVFELWRQNFGTG